MRDHDYGVILIAGMAADEISSHAKRRRVTNPGNGTPLYQRLQPMVSSMILPSFI